MIRVLGRQTKGYLLKCCSCSMKFASNTPVKTTAGSSTTPTPTRTVSSIQR